MKFGIAGQKVIAAGIPPPLNSGSILITWKGHRIPSFHLIGVGTGIPFLTLYYGNPHLMKEFHTNTHTPI